MTLDFRRLGEQLRAERESLGLSQKDFGRVLGFTQAKISLLETGRRFRLSDEEGQRLRERLGGRLPQVDDDPRNAAAHNVQPSARRSISETLDDLDPIARSIIFSIVGALMAVYETTNVDVLEHLVKQIGLLLNRDDMRGNTSVASALNAIAALKKSRRGQPPKYDENATKESGEPTNPSVVLPMVKRRIHRRRPS